MISRQRALLVGIALLCGAASLGGSSADVATSMQPIGFSHQLHAGANGIPCLYCHAYARRGPVAGLPSVQRCVGCHTTIAKDKPDVVKLMTYWDKRAPIPWLRVHDLPDYVHFNHKRHVLAEVDCRECHGDVASMGSVQQVSSLQMGFCLECHARRKAPTDCLACHY